MCKTMKTSKTLEQFFGALYLKPQKCQFEVTEVEYLGVIISEDRIAMDPVKVNGVKNWKQSTTLRELCAFLGFLNFY